MKLLSEDILHIGDKLFLFSNSYNLLYSIDIKTGCYDFIGGIPNRHLNKEKMVSTIVEWNRCIYLIPLQEGNIWEYSIDTGRWCEIKIKFYSKIGENAYFRNAITYDGNLFIFGGYYPAIIKLDLSTKEITYNEITFDNKENNERDIFFRGAPVHDKDFVYLASANDNSILKYSLSTNEYEWIKVGREGEKFSGIEWDGKYFWLSPRQNGNDIIKMTYSEEYRFPMPFELNKKKCVYIGLCFVNDRLIIPSGAGENGTITLNNDGIFETSNNHYIFYKKKNAEIFSQEIDGSIVFIDSKGNRKEYSGDISYNTFILLLEKIGLSAVQLKKITEETELFDLKSWLPIVNSGG